MARTHFDGFEVTSAGISGTDNTVIELNGEGALQLPADLDFASTDILRDGQDLILRDGDGTSVTINNYFNADPAPALLSSTGHQSLSPQLVQSFVQHDGDIQIANASTFVNDSTPIGEISEVVGDAKIIRTDGTQETATLGAPIFEGDIVETEGDGAVNMVFIDESSFAVSENARIAIDEFVFDTSTEAGKQDFSILRGVFMYTSGLIGRENPDAVDIDTPVGSIGIRGTIIGGKINPSDESQITVIEGAIVVRNAGGELLLSVQFDTVKLSGFDAPMSHVGALRVQDVANDYGAVKDVSATLFSTFNDQMQEQGPSNGLDEKSSEGEQPSEEQSSQSDDLIQEDATQDTNSPNTELKSKQDLNTKSDDNDRDTNAESRSSDTLAHVNEQHHFIQKIDEINNLSLEFKSGGHVHENAAAGTVVGQVSPATGIAYGIKYALVNDMNGLFVIDSDTGVITLNQSAPDYDTIGNPVLDLQIQVVRTDTGTARVIDMPVHLQDVNEAATITYGATNTLSESNDGLAADVVIQDISVVDPDINPAFTSMAFSVTDNRFAVRIINGEYKLVAVQGAKFDFEQEQSVSLSIKPSDGTNFYDAQQVTVHIGDLNDETPTDIDITNTTVAENNAGAIVGALTAVDPDVNDTHNYTIVEDPSGLFEIVDNKLQLKSGVSADYESQQSHDIVIKVTDANGLEYQKTFTVNVTDANDKAVFTNGITQQITETPNNIPLANDKVVHTIHMTDPDNNPDFRQHTFTVSDERFYVRWNDTASHYELVAKAGTILDYETEPSINMTITANDNVNVYDPHSITVKLYDLNENPTGITLDNDSIDENAEGILVGKLTTTDPDADPTFTYTIENADSNTIFEIVNDELRVKDGYSADYEAKQSHIVRIRVEDQGGLTYTKDFTIYVNDVNETPVIELDLADRFDLVSNVQGILPIGERGAVVGKINIADPEGKAFDVSDFSLDNDKGKYFEIISENGDFFLKLKDQYSFKLNAPTPNIFDHNVDDFIQSEILNLNQKWDVTVFLNDDASTQGSMTIGITLGDPNKTFVLEDRGQLLDLDPFMKGAIVLGGDGDDIIRIQNEDFKLIRGGKGFDKLILDGSLGGDDDLFNFVKLMSNTSANSADLRSIEEIVVSEASNDIQNTLRMSMEDVLNLLRTSDNGELKITAAEISKFSDRAKIEFVHEGSQTSLLEYDQDGIDGSDFEKQSDTFHDSNGHQYHVFTHDLGTILLDVNLMNGETGGA